MAKIHTKLLEFLMSPAANPKTAPTKPATPTKPSTPPKPSPTRPSPIRRDKPSVDPKPRAEDDLVKRFVAELRKTPKEVKVSMKKIKG